MSRKFILVIAFILCAGFGGEVFAQNAQQKTQELIVALGKSKYKKKEISRLKDILTLKARRL